MGVRQAGREIRQEKEHLEFEERIPGFLQDRLSNGELERFLDHYDRCRECREELAVRYLIEEGLSRLETGEPFNLQKELAGYVSIQKNRLERRFQFVRLTMVYEVFTVIIFIGCAAAYLMRR